MAYYLSAYAIAVVHGFRGSEEEWLASLRGAPGKSAYEVAVECGYQGTKEEWLETLKGQSDLPVAAAAAPTGYDTYAAAGDNLPVVEKATQQQEAVGVGKQIVFLPNRANLTTAPVVKLNNGETVEIRLRAAEGQGGVKTITVPVGALMEGTPYTLTFDGTYWLIDSVIGGIGGEAERVTLDPVTIGSGSYDNVQDAMEAAAAELGDKVDKDDVDEVEFVTASDAVANVTNDEAPITPAGVKAIVDEYGGDAQNIKVFSLDDVSYAALFAATEDAKTAIFLAYNVGNYQPDPEEEVYPYDPTLLILKMKGFTAGVGATFEQDADLVTYTDDDPPVAVNVRKAVRVTVAPGATVGAADVITVEITETRADKMLPPIIHIATSGNYNVTGATTWVANSTSNSKGDFIKKDGTLYICITDSAAGTWSQRKNNYKSVAFTFQERAYDETKAYSIGDKCVYSTTSYDQHVYVCKVDSSTGNAPTDTSKWQDVGAVFALTDTIDFREFESAMNAGLCRVSLSTGIVGITTTTTTTAPLNSTENYIAFIIANRHGYSEFAIVYNASTGAMTKTKYTVSGYATE